MAASSSRGPGIETKTWPPRKKPTAVPGVVDKKEGAKAPSFLSSALCEPPSPAGRKAEAGLVHRHVGRLRGDAVGHHFQLARAGLDSGWNVEIGRHRRAARRHAHGAVVVRAGI